MLAVQCVEAAELVQDRIRMIGTQQAFMQPC